MSLVVGLWLLLAAEVRAQVDATTPTAQGPAPPPVTQSDPTPSVTAPVADVISLSPGSTCLDEARLEARVGRWLERDTVDRRVRVHVVGGASPTDVRFVLYRAGGEPAERVLESPPEDCENLTAALALSIALAIDAAILEHFSLPDDEKLVEVREPKPTPGLLDSMLPTPEAHRFSVQLGLSGGLTTGLLTAVAPAGRASLHGAIAPWLEARLSGLYTKARNQRLPQVPSVEFDAEVWAGRGDLCAIVPATKWLTAAGCAGFQGGVFITQPRRGLSAGGRVAKALWAIGLGLEARIVLTDWFSLAIYADLSLPLRKRTIMVRDESGQPIGTGRSLLPAGVMAGAGPVFRLF